MHSYHVFSLIIYLSWVKSMKLLPFHRYISPQSIEAPGISATRQTVLAVAGGDATLECQATGGSPSSCKVGLKVNKITMVMHSCNIEGIDYVQ